MSEFEQAFKYTTRIEQLIESRLNGHGRGLFEKSNSVREHMPPEIFRKVHRISQIRNSLAHNPDHKMSNFARFAEQCEEVLAYLEGLREGNNSTAVPRMPNEPLFSEGHPPPPLSQAERISHQNSIAKHLAQQRQLKITTIHLQLVEFFKALHRSIHTPVKAFGAVAGCALFWWNWGLVPALIGGLLGWAIAACLISLVFLEIVGRWILVLVLLHALGAVIFLIYLSWGVGTLSSLFH